MDINASVEETKELAKEVASFVQEMKQEKQVKQQTQAFLAYPKTQRAILCGCSFFVSN